MGTFGVVRLVQDKRSKATFALKSMRKQKVYEMGQVEHVFAECKLLAECDHPFIVELVRTYEDEHSIHLLLELTQGGELFSVLRQVCVDCHPTIMSSSPMCRHPTHELLSVLAAGARRRLPRASLPVAIPSH